MGLFAVMQAAGKRDKRVTIEQAIETQSDSNETTVTWSTFAGPLWMSLAQSGGREVWQAQQINPELDSIWTGLWVKGVTPKMRVKFSENHEQHTSYFDIKSVRSDYHDNELILECTEDVDQ